MTATLVRSPQLGGTRSRAIREPWLDATAIGRRLREAREGAGLSQRTLVEGTGYTAAYVSRLEAGERLASWSCLRRLASKLPVSATWLESGDHPGSVDLTLSREEAVALLALIGGRTVAAVIRARIVEQLRVGLGLPEPAPVLQRLLAGEEVPSC